MNHYTPQQIAEIDRHLAYIKKQNRASLINFIMCVLAVIGIISCVLYWPYDKVNTVNKQPVDTVYTWYDHNGNGHIGFLDHSKLKQIEK